MGIHDCPRRDVGPGSTWDDWTNYLAATLIGFAIGALTCGFLRM